ERSTCWTQGVEARPPRLLLGNARAGGAAAGRRGGGGVARAPLPLGNRVLQPAPDGGAEGHARLAAAGTAEAYAAGGGGAAPRHAHPLAGNQEAAPGHRPGRFGAGAAPGGGYPAPGEAHHRRRLHHQGAGRPNVAAGAPRGRAQGGAEADLARVRGARVGVREPRPAGAGRGRAAGAGGAGAVRAAAGRRHRDLQQALRRAAEGPGEAGCLHGPGAGPGRHLRRGGRRHADLHLL
ncbi:MAG: hypothetical protein AVDCRST_MAG89-1389, partial [uncultured Gemmatimonadetes bacterium]